MKKIFKLKKIKEHSILLGIMFFMLSLIGCGKKYDVNYNDYLRVKFAGKDGEGTATVEVDEEQLKLDLSKMEDCLVDYFKQDEYIIINVEPRTNLKNGDKVTITVTFDENINGKNRLKFYSDEVSYDVTGLN